MGVFSFYSHCHYRHHHFYYYRYYADAAAAGDDDGGRNLQYNTHNVFILVLIIMISIFTVTTFA